MSKIKILISTDSAAIHSGLAETCRNIFVPLLQRYPNKYHLEQIGFFNFQPKEPVPWKIHTTKVNRRPDGQMEPDGNDRYGVQTFPGILDAVKPDIVWGYGDMWHFQHLIDSPMRNTYRLCVYYTIDGSPYYGNLRKDGSTDWGGRLAKCDEVCVLSYFGKKVLKKSCKELADTNIRVMYHPLDMSRFPVYSEDQKKEARAKTLPAIYDDDIFLAGWMGRNQFRKQNYKLWEITHYIIYGDYIECRACDRVTIKEWDVAGRCTMPSDELTLYDPGYKYDHCWHCKSSNIKQGVPNPKFYLWLHMPKTDQGYHPIMHEEIWGVSQHLIYTSGVEGIAGISKDDVAKLLAIWDCMLYPSGGEGFGNPPFEAMAAGTPIVYSNYSSHAEFCKFGGLPVRVANYCPELQISIQRSAIDTGHAVQQVNRLIRDRELLKHLGDSARRHAAQFAIPHLTPVWDRVFTEMMQRPLPMHSSRMYAQAL